METPVIAKKSPYVLNLEPGTYWWCSCGKAKSQPFCDGSHKGTEFSPMKLDIQEQSKVALCGCKHSKNPPRCDGGHNSI